MNWLQCSEHRKTCPAMLLPANNCMLPKKKVRQELRHAVMNAGHRGNYLRSCQ